MQGSYWRHQHYNKVSRAQAASADYNWVQSGVTVRQCLDKKVFGPKSAIRTARSTNGQRVWRCGQPSMAADTVRQAELARLELENTQLWVFKGMLPGHFVLLV